MTFEQRETRLRAIEALARHLRAGLPGGAGGLDEYEDATNRDGKPCVAAWRFHSSVDNCLAFGDGATFDEARDALHADLVKQLRERHTRDTAALVMFGGATMTPTGVLQVTVPVGEVLAATVVR